MPNKYTTPKQDFLQEKSNSDQHARLIESVAFNRAISVAKDEYVRRLHEMAPRNLDSPNFAGASAMAFQRLQGVEDFLLILFNLGEQIQPMPKKDLELNLKEPAKN